MLRPLLVLCTVSCLLSLFTPAAPAAPVLVRQEIAPDETGEVDAVGAVDGARPLPVKVVGDTVWIADWSFDAADGGCDDTGWTKIDNRILNDGSDYWHVDTSFDGAGGITGRAAILAKHDLCWVVPTGYGNIWDYSIILKYRGAGSTVSFDFLSDSEPGFDFFSVEADSAGASESRVDYAVNPEAASAAVFREELLSYAGLQSAGIVTALALPDFGEPATTHECYIRFSSDGGYADEDGLYRSHWGAGCIVDNITVTGDLAYGENFEGPPDPNVTFANTALALPFGEWARLYKHITDNDKCTENTTCAWLWTDPLTLARDPNMAFGPGGAVIHAWLDNIIVSPWVSLASTPSATGTALTWRRFAGNDYASGTIVQGWSVRSRIKVDNVDTPSPGDSIECSTGWGHANQWNSLTSFVWGTNRWEMTSYIGSEATEIQIRLRVADGGTCYLSCPIRGNRPGPGPFNDRIRISRRILSGPAWNVGIDTRTQAQDCFPTKPSTIGSGHGEHHEPETDTSAPLFPYLFGSCAFSTGTELGINKTSPNLITGDSIYADVTDARGAGGITSIQWHGAIVSGPHAGKAPAPFTVGANGFFAVQPDSARKPDGTWVAGRWFVDLDDSYFRGGDQLVYFWYATDAAGGGSSLPSGIGASSFPPASVTAAEIATDGLYEVSFLPAIDWAASYLDRLAADAHGDLDPTAAEVAGSSQRNCFLYYQHTNSGRRSGPTQRTSFMYALDRLGYAGHYDVYDIQGYGNTSNQMGGRATVAQASGYALLIEDDGRSNLTVNVPDGSDLDAQKINQAQWYRNYLAQGLTGRAKTASLWLLGESTAYNSRSNPLFTSNFGLTLISNSQGSQVNPDVVGVAPFTSWDGCTTNSTGDRFTLNGGCPTLRKYDAATASGTAVVTHRYQSGATQGGGAIIMNRNTAQHWNTVWMGFGLFDVRHPLGIPTQPPPDVALVEQILTCLLPASCRQTPVPTGTGEDPAAALPRVSALHQNVPNPFNPTTTIRFDLAHEGQVELRIYDTAGRTVKILRSQHMPAGRNFGVIWNGLGTDDARAPSGVYFYRLVTEDITATKKMVLLH